MSSRRRSNGRRRAKSASGDGATASTRRAPPPRLTRTIALVGLMGAGKSAVGRRLAEGLGRVFRDSDDEIEKAAALSIPEIFERFGESYFREGERRVIARLLEDPPHVLATGGGAYVDAETRGLLRDRAYTIWLKADLDTLAARCARRDNRPLLRNGELRETLGRLMDARYPVYAEADAVVETADGPHETVVAQALKALRRDAIVR